MNFLENEFKKYGVIDIYRNAWEFDKWTISEDPQIGPFQLMEMT